MASTGGAQGSPPIMRIPATRQGVYIRRRHRIWNTHLKPRFRQADIPDITPFNERLTLKKSHSGCLPSRTTTPCALKCDNYESTFYSFCTGFWPAQSRSLTRESNSNCKPRTQQPLNQPLNQLRLMNVCKYATVIV